MKNQHFKKITSSEFLSHVVRAKANAVVNLSTEWSGASHLNDIALTAIVPHYHDKVDFYQVDLDSEPSITDAFRIELVPTLLFFNEGKLVDKLTGLAQRNIISEKIQQLVNHRNN